jgi:glycosyltransferase involved in cell wall biosynthesis
MKSVCILLQNDYELDIRVRRKAEALVAAGYSVDVLALRSSHTKRTYTLHGVNVYTVSLGKKRGSLPRYAFEYLAFFLWAFVRVTLQMHWRRYAVIDVNTLPDFLIFASVFAKWKGAKLVLDMHEITPEFYMSKYGISENSWSVRLLKHLEKMSFDFADHVITINEPIQNLLVHRGLPHSKSTVIMNAVDESLFASNPRPVAAADMVAAPGRFVMMYHGTLTRIYGLDIAIEAFGMVHKEMPGAELWILGDGPEKDSLKSLTRQRGLASKVRLVGSVLPTEVSAWLDKCDIGVLPMRRDVFLDFAYPNKLSEYIIMGKAVIIPRLKAIRHYFSEQALAYCEPNTPGDLAKQIARLYRDRGLRARLAARAKEEYAPIGWDVMKHRYLSVMEDMAGPGCRSAERSHAPEATVLSR